MPWVVDEWHKRTGILEKCKGKKQLRDGQGEKKKENVK